MNRRKVACNAGSYILLSASGGKVARNAGSYILLSASGGKVACNAGSYILLSASSGGKSPIVVTALVGACIAGDLRFV